MEIDINLKENLLADVENICECQLTEETKEDLQRAFEITIGCYLLKNSKPIIVVGDTKLDMDIIRAVLDEKINPVQVISSTQLEIQELKAGMRMGCMGAHPEVLVSATTDMSLILPPKPHEIEFMLNNVPRFEYPIIFNEPKFNHVRKSRKKIKPNSRRRK